MKRPYSELICFAIGIAVTVILQGFVFDDHSERRFTLYNLQRELHAGMSPAQVESVISRHSAPFVHRVIANDMVFLRVDFRAAQSCLLSISFRNGVLASSRIRGEDGPHEVFSDAPPDINPQA